ncbi:flagellar assembly protein T N-terminal domain-containing protein [Pseudoalteromonas tunicata]|uniref:flagella assembly protein FlgT n=1 Tax=Pseudoalteromonas tunicata TaxID=314281 RepID=UPI00273DAA97|nr:flagella assembly protein FlgT [Pseudoalteromonas tunicata]MDP5212484.1 flagellar assembly protein T N-terminal domain-containing protein [Pseudoalteromonas tunicata]
MSKYLLALLFFSCASLNAQWYESTGQAQIRDGDTKSAKSRATEDAIKQALVYAGASVSSIQSVADGVIMQDQLKVRSHGEINNIEMIDETYSADYVSVTLRLDIFAQDKQCFASEFKKSVAITQTQFNNREHALEGQIFDINKAFSERLYQTIKNNEQALSPRAYFKKAIRVNNYFTEQLQLDPRMIEQIADTTNSQYVLLSQISDTSMGEQQNSKLLFWQDRQFERFFSIEFILMNALTHELVWQQDYQTSGVWRFDKTARPDVFSNKFWRSEFGSAIDQLTRQISLELRDTLSCLPLQGQIRNITDNTIVINLGSEHGVKKGQSFAIAYKSNILDTNGQSRPYIIESNNKVRIEQVFQHSAIASSISDELLANIQRSDLVLLIEWQEPEL